MEEKGPVKTVNRHQLHDLGITQEEEQQKGSRICHRG